MSEFGTLRARGTAMPQLRSWMRSHAKRRRTAGENIRALLLGCFLASGLFGLTTYWVGLTVEEQRADMGDQFDFIKATLLAHAMSSAMQENGLPRVPCPDLNGDGVAEYSCGPGELEGYVPWKTLGLDPAETVNAWGIPVTYKIDRPNAHTCAGRLPRSGNLIMTRQYEGQETRSQVNAVFVLQSFKPKPRGRTGLTYIDAGTGSLFLGLCQNADTMGTVSF